MDKRAALSVTEQQLISCSRWRTPSIDHIVCSQQRDTDLTVSTSSPGVHIFAAAIQCHTYLHTHMYKSSVLITLGKAATVPPNHTGRRTPNATPPKTLLGVLRKFICKYFWTMYLRLHVDRQARRSRQFLLEAHSSVSLLCSVAYAAGLHEHEAPFLEHVQKKTSP
jgi:hypothetical protein